MRDHIARNILAVLTALFVFMPATTAFANDTKVEAEQAEQKPLADRAAAINTVVSAPTFARCSRWPAAR